MLAGGYATPSEVESLSKEWPSDVLRSRVTLESTKPTSLSGLRFSSPKAQGGSLEFSPGAVWFEENRGQVKSPDWKPRPDILYYGVGSGLSVFVRRDGVSYQVAIPERWEAVLERGADLQRPKKRVAAWRIWRVDLEFVGGVIQGAELSESLPGYMHYYNVPEGRSPVLFVRQYRQLRLREVWPGVDLVLFERGGES